MGLKYKKEKLFIYTNNGVLFLVVKFYVDGDNGELLLLLLWRGGQEKAIERPKATNGRPAFD